MKFDSTKWSMEIHHIDVGAGAPSPGDATLIIVKYDGDVVRTALIDGGNQSGKKFPVLTYLEKTVGDDGVLDVMVNTHYDKDHLQGLIGLLRHDKGEGVNYEGNRGFPKNPHHMFRKTRIYDLGFNHRYSSAQSFNTSYHRYLLAIHGLRKGVWSYKYNSIVSPNNQDQEISKSYEQEDRYYRDLYKVKGKGLQNDQQRQHVTQYVSDHPDMVANKRLPLGWLVGREILWSSGTSDKDNPYVDGTQSGAVKSGAPAIFCVAANTKIINQSLSAETFSPASADESPSSAEADGGELAGTYDNQCSLAFIIRFNNFRYYVGGDLPTEIEDDLAEALNPKKDIKKRIIAMKSSHHGSAESTSQSFVEKLMPSAVIVSCGLKNLFCHPHAPTLKRLIDAKYPLGAKMDRCYLTGFHNPNRNDVTKENHFITRAMAKFDDPLTDKTKYGNSINIFINKYYKPVEVAGGYLCRNLQGKWVKITAGEEVMSDGETLTGDVVLTVSYAQSCNDGTPTKEKSKSVFTVNCTHYFDLIKYANNNWKYRDYDQDKSFPHNI